MRTRTARRITPAILILTALIDRKNLELCERTCPEDKKQAT